MSAEKDPKKDRPVRGLVVTGTAAGMTRKQFKELLDVANDYHKEGLTLMGVVQLAENNVGAIFVRQSAKPVAAPRESAVLTDDDDMGFPWPR